MKATKLTKRKAIHADLVFHTSIANAGHNSLLARFLDELRQPGKKPFHPPEFLC